MEGYGVFPLNGGYAPFLSSSAHSGDGGRAGSGPPPPVLQSGERPSSGVHRPLVLRAAGRLVGRRQVPVGDVLVVRHRVADPALEGAPLTARSTVVPREPEDVQVLELGGEEPRLVEE